jgi:hypothetical protein
VDAVPERQVGAGGPAEVQPVGVGIALGVAVCGRQRERDGLPGPDGAPCQLDVLLGHAHRPDVGDGEVAKELLGRLLRQAGVVAQPGCLVGVLQQQEGAQAEHVGGGFVPGRQQQQAHAGQLLVVELATADQPAEQVVAGLGALAGDQLGEVGHDVRGALRALLGREVEVDRGAGGLLEPPAVGVGHPQQLANDHGRHRQRERLHQVDRRAVVGHPLQVLLDDLGDARLELPHPPGGELAGDQPAVAGVVGGRPSPGSARAGRRGASRRSSAP